VDTNLVDNHPLHSGFLGSLSKAIYQTTYQAIYRGDPSSMDKDKSILICVGLAKEKTRKDRRTKSVTIPKVLAKDRVTSLS
jgi:hypothetical protein